MTAGTLVEYCVTAANYATRLSDGFTDEETDPSMCGGVTAHVAYMRRGMRPYQWVILPEASSGLHHLGKLAS